VRKGRPSGGAIGRWQNSEYIVDLLSHAVGRVSRLAKILVCKNCERDISKPVELSEDITEGINRTSPATDYVVPVGQAVSLVLERSLGKGPVVVWMNGNDLLGRITFDPKGLGCCGYNGQPNTICACSNIVGALYIDYCDAHRFQPNSKASYWSDLSESDPSRLEKIYTKNRVRKNRF